MTSAAAGPSVATPSPPAPGGRADPPAGMALGLGAYVSWGLFPLVFVLLAGVGPVETVAHRVVWSMAFCLALALVAGRWVGGTAALCRLRAREVAVLGLAAVFLAANWGIFVYGVTDGQVVQVSLGYFTNPLVSVVLGVVLLRERLGRARWAAVALGAAAVVVLTVEDGRVPWIALSLAVSFGLYGLLKNRVGRSVAALPGMVVETAVLAPAALGYLAVVHAGGGGAFGADLRTTLLLVAVGPLTAGVLLLFAAAARRIRLSTLGLLQYVTPSLHLIVGVAVLGEPLPPGRLAGFALVWAALAVLTVDSLVQVRRRQAEGRAAAPGGGA